MGKRVCRNLPAPVLLALGDPVTGGCGGQESGPGHGPLIEKLPARSLSSRLALDVYVLVEEHAQSKRVGYTPAPEPVAIPPCWYWWVEPVPPVDMEAVAHEVEAQGIPGLRLRVASDADLAHLRDLNALRMLGVAYTQVTDAGSAHLRDLNALRMLDVAYTQVTDAGLAHLKALNGLRMLDVAYTQVTDAGLAHVKDLSGLQTLRLECTQLTDAGLAHLKALKALQSLHLWGTQVTQEGVGKQLSCMPGLRIETPNWNYGYAGL